MVHKQSESYLTATKDYDGVLQYQDSMLQLLDTFERKLDAQLRDYA